MEVYSWEMLGKPPILDLRFVDDVCLFSMGKPLRLENRVSSFPKEKLRVS
jgi:hypothetical protein